MSTRHEDNDGSDIFWPGYVDATTNLILNLLFLLTILIVAVFMFALELGRTSQIQAEKPKITVTEPSKELQSPPPSDHTNSENTVDPIEENIALKIEIQRLNTLLAQQIAEREHSGGGLIKTVRATSSVHKPQSGLDKTLGSDLEIMVKFKNDAVTLTQAEQDQLLETLKPILESGGTNIHVEVPAGFSEAKRMGFYRAMSVRNLLIEMNMPKEKINVSVVEGKNDANASVVRVRSN